MQIRDYLIRRLMVLPILLIGVSLIVFALTRIVSTASLSAAVAAPLLAWWLGQPMMALLLLVIGAIVWIKHADNIGRLLRGQENRFSIGSRKS